MPPRAARCGICCSPASMITMWKPKYFHEMMKNRLYSTSSGSASHSWVRPLAPTASRPWSSSPSGRRICRHTTPVTTSDSTYGAKNSVRRIARPWIRELSSNASPSANGTCSADRQHQDDHVVAERVAEQLVVDMPAGSCRARRNCRAARGRSSRRGCSAGSGRSGRSRTAVQRQRRQQEQQHGRLRHTAEARRRLRRRRREWSWWALVIEGTAGGRLRQPPTRVGEPVASAAGCCGDGVGRILR